MSFSRRSSGGVSSSYDGSLGNLTPFITHPDPLDSRYLSRSMLEITRDVCYNNSNNKTTRVDETLGKEFNYVQKNKIEEKRSIKVSKNYDIHGDVYVSEKNEALIKDGSGMSRRRFSISYVQNSCSDSTEKQKYQRDNSNSYEKKNDDCSNLFSRRSSSQLKNIINDNLGNRRNSQQLTSKRMNIYQANQLLCSLLERDPCRLNNSGLYSYNSRDHSYQINTFQDGCKHWYSNNNREVIDPFSDTNNSYIPQYTTNARRAMYELIGTSENARPDPDLSDDDLSLRFVRGTLVVCDLHNKLQLNVVPPIFGKSFTYF